MNAQFPGDMYI